jgi:hypothetical protein
MGRRHTAGAVGNQAVGGVQVDNTTLSAAENLDITVDPIGTGLFKVAGDTQLQAQGDLRFADSDSSNYVAFQAPATVASNVTWTLPDADGTANQSLITNGSGTLSWATAAAAITDNTSDSGTNYVTFTTLTSGFLTATRVSTTKLTFQPSTGTLIADGPVVDRRIDGTQTGNYTLALGDRNKVVAMNNSTAATVTVPNDSTVNFPTGSVVYVARVGSGTLTLAAEAGVTLSKTGTFAANEEIAVRKRAANSWIVIDSLTAGTGTGTGGTASSGGGYTISTYTSTGSSTYTVA